jgi:hypothetical protein
VAFEYTEQEVTSTSRPVESCGSECNESFGEATDPVAESIESPMGDTVDQVAESPSDNFSENKPYRSRAFSPHTPPERNERRDRGGSRRPDNVHLNLNPRLLELAEDIAQENGMDLQEYLVQALSLVIKTHADKLGMSVRQGGQQFVTEYTKEKGTPVTRVSTKKGG